MFLQLVANGLVTGSVIAIASVGVALVYGILRLVNFAYGDFMAFGALAAYAFNGPLGLGIVVSALLAMLAFFFQAEDGIRAWSVTEVQTCALPILRSESPPEKNAEHRGINEQPRRTQNQPSEPGLGGRRNRSARKCRRKPRKIRNDPQSQRPQQSAIVAHSRFDEVQRNHCENEQSEKQLAGPAPREQPLEPRTNKPLQSHVEQ